VPPAPRRRTRPKSREGIAKARQKAADRLVELQGERAHLEAEGRRVAAQTGPARFLAVRLGTDAETVIRSWWRRRGIDPPRGGERVGGSPFNLSVCRVGFRLS